LILFDFNLRTLHLTVAGSLLAQKENMIFSFVSYSPLPLISQITILPLLFPALSHQPLEKSLSAAFEPHF
jgi:hypothetical protein